MWPSNKSKPVRLLAKSTPNAANAANAMRSFWEGVDGGFAHIDYTWPSHVSEAAMFQRWRTQWLDAWSAQFGRNWLQRQRVGDYGIGGGLLGELLCREYGISHYVGFDVAKRQLGLASQRLRNASCSHDLVFVNGSRGDATDFALYRLDAFVSQQVIQHFPSKRYTEDWLRALAAARIPRLMLEVRFTADPAHPKNEVRFNEWGKRPIKSRSDVKMGTVLQCEWLHERLPRYGYVWASNSSRRFKACVFELLPT
jgi:hypothetical protein